MGGDERRGRKQLTTENTECTEGRAELEEQKEGPEEMERLHFLRPA